VELSGFDGLLAKARLTKGALAEELGLAQGTVYGWEELPKYAKRYLEMKVRVDYLEARVEDLEGQLVTK